MMFFMFFVFVLCKIQFYFTLIASTALTGKILSSITEAGFEISALQMVSAPFNMSCRYVFSNRTTDFRVCK